MVSELSSYVLVPEPEINGITSQSAFLHLCLYHLYIIISKMFRIIQIHIIHSFNGAYGTECIQQVAVKSQKRVNPCGILHMIATSL